MAPDPSDDTKLQRHAVQLDELNVDLKESKLDRVLQILAILGVAFLTTWVTSRYNNNQIDLQQTENMYGIIRDLHEGRIGPRPALQMLTLSGGERSSNAIITLMESAADSLHMLLGGRNGNLPSEGWPLPEYLFVEGRPDSWFDNLWSDQVGMTTQRNADMWLSSQNAFASLGERAIPVLNDELARASSLEKVRAILHALAVILPDMSEHQNLAVTLQRLVLNPTPARSQRDASFIRGLAIAILALGGSRSIDIDIENSHDLSYWDFTGHPFDLVGVTQPGERPGKLDLSRTSFAKNSHIRNLHNTRLILAQTMMGSCTFENCSFTRSTILAPASLPSGSPLNIQGGSLINVEFINIDLIGSTFEGAYFERVTFNRCDLSEIGADAAAVRSMVIDGGECQQSILTHLTVNDLTIILRPGAWSGARVSVFTPGASIIKRHEVDFESRGRDGIHVTDRYGNEVRDPGFTIDEIH